MNSNNDFAGINRALPLCRLPFRECWFQLLQADRQSVSKTGVYFWSAHQRGNPALGFVHHDGNELTQPRPA